ncbi:HAD family hydrolase, partial [Patulibacter sp. S7RM1-6]
MRPELVVFDCDGVLVDTERPQAEVLASTLAELAGRPGAVTGDEILARYKGQALDPIAADVSRRLGAPLPDEWIAVFRARREPYFRRVGVPAIPGARDAVEAVRDAGLPYALATQGRADKTALTLGLAGLDDLFPPALRFSADDVPRPKPAPDLVLHVAATLGAAPERTAVVEDSVPGVTGAVAAGTRVLGLASD